MKAEDAAHGADAPSSRRARLGSECFRRAEGAKDIRVSACRSLVEKKLVLHADKSFVPNPFRRVRHKRLGFPHATRTCKRR